VSRRGAVVTLLTDFGTADGFVGAMKGVITRLAPTARILDITHDIPPGDIAAGAFALEAAARFFPPSTVHVAVIDPGVGTARRALAIEAGGQVFVGPDNGLLSLATIGKRSTVVLSPARIAVGPVSATFHGRDLFAPAAAKLANGIAVSRLGKPVHAIVELVLPAVARGDGRLVGEVIHADRFGNLTTNITAEDIRNILGRKSAKIVVAVGSRRISGGLIRTYGEGRAGELLALINSGARLEIARREGSAAALLKYRAGHRLRVRCVMADRG